VFQDILKEEKTLAQIAAEYEVHPTQLKNWRALALEGLPGLFEKQDRTVELKAAHEQQLTELYAGIGKLRRPFHSGGKQAAWFGMVSFYTLSFFRESGSSWCSRLGRRSMKELVNDIPGDQH
jgi:transposase